MPGPTKRLSNPADFDEVLNAHDTWLFDCDGVLWGGARGDELTPNVNEAIELLRSLNKTIAFITNNATKSRHQYLDKFHALGFTSVKLEEIYTCGSASAVYLRDTVLPKLDEDKRGVYVVGQEGLEKELLEAGVEWTGGSDPADDVLLPYQDFSSITPDPSIGVVLFSFNMHLNYKQLSKAYSYLGTNPGCQLILTNDDRTVLIPGGVCPGEGAMASVLYSARKDLVPEVVGKPYQPLLDVVKASLHFDPERTIMIGDRLETDVLFGKRGHLSTMLVLTGSSIIEDLEELPTAASPDFVALSIGEITKSSLNTLKGVKT